MLWKVFYRARALSSGWIRQEAVVTAVSEADAMDKMRATLLRQCRIGSWFVDYSVERAEQVG